MIRHVIPLDSTGHAYPSDEDDRGSLFVQKLDIGTVPQDGLLEYADTLLALLGPALLAVSLMHCKNTDIRAVDPPERLSRKH